MAKLEVTRRKVVRAELEFADGEVIQLTGDDADRYQQLVIDQGVQAWNHGARIEPLPWKTIKPAGG